MIENKEVLSPQAKRNRLRGLPAAYVGLVLGASAAVACGTGQGKETSPANTPSPSPTLATEVLMPPTPDPYCQIQDFQDLTGQEAERIPTCLERLGYEIVSQEELDKTLDLQDYLGKPVLLTFFSSSTEGPTEAHLRQVFDFNQKTNFKVKVIFVESGRQSPGQNSVSIIETEDPVLYQQLTDRGALFLLNRLPNTNPSGDRPGTDAPLTIIIDREGIIKDHWRGPVPWEQLTQII